MFDIAWSELLIIAVVALIVVGPKDLPKMLRIAGQAMAKVRRMASEFQGQVNEAIREADLEDVKKAVDDLRNLNPTNVIQSHLGDTMSSVTSVETAVRSEMAGVEAQLSASASEPIDPETGFGIIPTSPPIESPAPVEPVAATAEPVAAEGPAAAPEPYVAPLQPPVAEPAAPAAVAPSPPEAPVAGLDHPKGA